jgi:hypothetical protein
VFSAVVRATAGPQITGPLPKTFHKPTNEFSFTRKLYKYFMNSPEGKLMTMEDIKRDLGLVNPDGPPLQQADTVRFNKKIQTALSNIRIGTFEDLDISRFNTVCLEGVGYERYDTAHKARERMMELPPPTRGVRPPEEWRKKMVTNTAKLFQANESKLLTPCFLMDKLGIKTRNTLYSLIGETRNSPELKGVIHNFRGQGYRYVRVNRK